MSTSHRYLQTPSISLRHPAGKRHPERGDLRTKWSTRKSKEVVDGGRGEGRGCTKKLKPNGSLPKTGTLRGGRGGGDEAARRISSLAVHYRATPSKRGLHTYTPKREHPANDKRGPAVQPSAERVHRNTNRVSSHTQRARDQGDHHSQRYNIHLSNQTFCMKTLN